MPHRVWKRVICMCDKRQCKDFLFYTSWFYAYFWRQQERTEWRVKLICSWTHTRRISRQDHKSSFTTAECTTSTIFISYHQVKRYTKFENERWCLWPQLANAHVLGNGGRGRPSGRRYTRIRVRIYWLHFTFADPISDSVIADWTA